MRKTRVVADVTCRMCQSRLRRQLAIVPDTWPPSDVVEAQVDRPLRPGCNFYTGSDGKTAMIVCTRSSIR